MLTVAKSSSFINSISIYEDPVLGVGKTRSGKSGPCHYGVYRQPSRERHRNKETQKLIEIAKTVVMAMMMKPEPPLDYRHRWS